MRATIEPPADREVTLTMSEEDAKYLTVFIGRTAEEAMRKLVGRPSPKVQILPFLTEEHLGTRLYMALFDLWR